MLPGFDQALRFFDRLLDDAPDFDRLLLEGDSALRNSSDVEQIVDQPRELIGLPARNGQGAIAAVAVELSSRDSVEHRRQRVAQLMPQHREEFVLALIGLREFSEPDFQFAFQFDAFGHVANEASRVDELAVFPQPARMDEDVLDRSVFASQRRLEVVDDLAAHQPVPELVEPLALDVKIGEVTADVFRRSVAEQFELRRICPQDFTFGTDLVEAFERILDEIRKLLLTKMERFFRFFASGFFGVKHAGLLLEQADRAKAFGLRSAARCNSRRAGPGYAARIL